MNSTTDIPETPQAFDPSNFTVVPARTFEDLRVGEIFRAPSRTLSDAHASAFQAVSAEVRSAFQEPIEDDTLLAPLESNSWRGLRIK